MSSLFNVQIQLRVTARLQRSLSRELIGLTGCCMCSWGRILYCYSASVKGYQRTARATNKYLDYQQSDGTACHLRRANNRNLKSHASSCPIKPSGLSDPLNKDKQSIKDWMDHQLTFQIHSLVGLIKCHFCDTREGPCGTDTLQGTRQRTCSRWFNQCSLYRRVFPNGTTAQVVRGCDRDCNKPSMKWTLGRYQITTHCKLCCDSDLCNTHLDDPCSRSSTSVASTILWLCVLVTLGLCQN